MDSRPTSSFEIRKAEVLSEYSNFSKRILYTIIEPEKVDNEDRLAISKVCWRPELKPLLTDVKFTVTKIDKNSIILMQNEVIAVNNNILQDPASTAFYLRHILELVALRSCLDNKVTHINLLALAIASFHTALQYLDNMIEQEHHVVWKNIPDWIKEIAAKVNSYKSLENHDYKCLQVISTVIEKLLPIQEQAYPSNTKIITDSDIQQAIQQALTLLPLLYPADDILTMGGDNRLLINKQSGLNTYGCSSRPRPWAITFSSCTSSSISDLAYQKAEHLRQALITHAFKDHLVNRCAEEYEKIREEISQLLYLERIPGTQIILTPSGTDSELYALYLSMQKPSTPVHNILISSTEIGSGTVYAAGGYHFDELTPLGKKVKKGEHLDGFSSEKVEVSVLELRHEDGKLKSMNEIDQSIENMVKETITLGHHVLIHLLDCSKTGIGGPSFDKITQLRKTYPSQIDVMVDAAQMRVGQSALHLYLEEGFMVLISGSKFFTGPPFSGALLIPPSISKGVHELTTLPASLADYSTSYELPTEWQHLTKSTFRKEANIGLLFRWRAALWEMKAFYSTTALEQFNSVSVFGSKIFNMIQTNPDLELIMAPPHTRGYLGSDLCWDQLPSIFTFFIYRNSDLKHQTLNYDEARFAYRCINIDIARYLPVQASDREYELARKRCHIGQPVRLQNSNGEWKGALRIAIGARLVSGVQFDNALGDTPEERLGTEVRTAGVVFSKLSVIVKYWYTLKSYNVNSTNREGAGYYQF